MDDPRNTDNAWIETVAMSVHFPDQNDPLLRMLGSVGPSSWGLVDTFSLGGGTWPGASATWEVAGLGGWLLLVDGAGAPGAPGEAAHWAEAGIPSPPASPPALPAAPEQRC